MTDLSPEASNAFKLPIFEILEDEKRPRALVQRLIRRCIKEYSRKNDFNPFPISRDFDTVSWRKFNHCGSMVLLSSCMHSALYCRAHSTRSQIRKTTIEHEVCERRL
jgi:hypothetical protein